MGGTSQSKERETGLKKKKKIADSQKEPSKKQRK